MNATILVTGATGNVGSEVVKALREKGLLFRAALWKIAEVKTFGLKAEESVHFDFLDSSTYEEAFKGVNAMFLIRPPALANPEKEMVPAISAAQEAGVSHIVLMSLLGAKNNLFVPHRKIEYLIRASGLSYTL